MLDHRPITAAYWPGPVVRKADLLGTTLSLSQQKSELQRGCQQAKAKYHQRSCASYEQKPLAWQQVRLVGL